MKKALAMIMIFALILTLGAAFAEGDHLAEIQERGTLRIGTEGNWSPWTYHDNDDIDSPLVGLEAEIGALIAHGLGVEPEFYEAEWGALLAGIDGGRFDIVCNGVDWTIERAEKFAFTIPYVYTEVVLVVRSDNEDIHSVADLAGRTTANSPSSTYAERAEKVGAAVTYVETLVETLMLVEQGRVDATINAKGSVDEYLEQHPEAKLKIVEVLPGDPVCYPISKDEDSASLLDAINAVLEKAHEDGTLAEISVKYFGVDLTNAPE